VIIIVIGLFFIYIIWVPSGDSGVVARDRYVTDSVGTSIPPKSNSSGPGRVWFHARDPRPGVARGKIICTAKSREMPARRVLWV
jgi:hypothetical protein